MKSDTIAAISTPLGEGGVGIIRISGPSSLSIIDRIFKASAKARIKPRYATHGWIFAGHRALDEAVLTYYKAPSSYTGEDVAEISCHGGITVLKAVLSLIIKKGARLAERGEFTKRALLNGKMDLSKAEAVIDMVKARTNEASLLAASHLYGSLASKMHGIRQKMIDLLTKIEVSIDYPEDTGIVNSRDQAVTIRQAIQSVDKLIMTADMGKMHREGLTAAIIGRPNVGKSSLLNALLKNERAIVDKQPGTTRDVIEEAINIKGTPFKLIDTAGIRESRNSVERLGIERANKATEDADMILLVLDISEKLIREDLSLINRVVGRPTIIVLNKADKIHILKANDIKANRYHKKILVSAVKGYGIKRLENLMIQTVSRNKVVAQNVDIMINLRQKQCLERARQSLEKAERSVKRGMQPDFISIDLRGAVAAMGEVTGDNVSDEVISGIFDKFCVGK